MAPLLVMEKVSPRKIDIIPDDTWMNYESLGVKVKQQPTLHDVPNCCWHLDMSGYRIFYATDMSSLEGIEAKNYDLYLIEANRESDDLDEAIRRKLNNGEFAYELRVRGTHFMTEQAKQFLADNMGEKSQYCFLHQHDPEQ